MIHLWFFLVARFILLERFSARAAIAHLSRSYASVSLVMTPKGKDDRLDWMPKHFKGLSTQKVDEESA
jgi:hypothetical protein